MKKKYWLLCLAGFLILHVQAQVLKNITPQPDPNLRGKFVITPPSFVKIDPTGPVRYIFYDVFSLSELSGRTTIQNGDYISLEVSISNKRYTPVPERGVNIDYTTSGVSNFKLLEISSAMEPRIPTLWKVSGNAGSFSLNYMGTYPVFDADNYRVGGYIVNQAGIPEISPTPGSAPYFWRINPVGANAISIQSPNDSRYFGYTYSQGASVYVPGSGQQRIAGDVKVAVVDNGRCPNGQQCDIKWFYKIYKVDTSSKQIAPATLPVGNYAINTVHRRLSLSTGMPAAFFSNLPGNAGPGAAQQWHLEKTSRGTYFITNVENRMALGVSKSNTGGIQLSVTRFDENNLYHSDSLQWTIRGPFEGKYTFSPLINKNTPFNGIITCQPNGAVGFSPTLGGSYWQEFMVDSVNGPLWGYVDMHTHPMSHLAFGTKGFYGAPDTGSLMPSGTIYRDAGFDVGETKPDCIKTDTRVTSVAQALGSCNAVHGGWGTDNNCGDYIRNAFVQTMEADLGPAPHNIFHGKDAHGYSTDASMAFANWPKYNDGTHQKMWIDWLRMAYESGLRVMVGLAHNNKVFGELAVHADPVPKDDQTAGDLQLREIISFVGRHSDFMEVAYTSADLKRIVKSNRMAVVVGVELDYMGNFPINMPLTDANKRLVAAEIDRLYSKGARYMFPIHMVDNAFGGTALYQDIMNIAQKLGSNTFWNIQCSNPEDSIVYTYSPLMDEKARQIFKTLTSPEGIVGLEFLTHLLPLPPGIMEILQPVLSTTITFSGIAGNLASAFIPPAAPTCTIPIRGESTRAGQRNARGMQPIGGYAVTHMMHKGIMIDIDHMSQHMVDSALMIATRFIYPVNSGHTGVRDPNATENQRLYSTLHKVSSLGGLFGVGWSGQNAGDWIGNYRKGIKGMFGKGVCFGSDANSFVYTPAPRPGSRVTYFNGFNQPESFGKRWDYNRDGMAHYGMVRDFIRDLRMMGASEELKVLYSSAQQFYLMWQKCEQQSRGVME